MSRSMLIVPISFLLLAHLASCGDEKEDNPSAHYARPTTVVFAARDLDLLGQISLTIEGEAFGTLDDEVAGDCTTPASISHLAEK